MPTGSRGTPSPSHRANVGVTQPESLSAPSRTVVVVVGVVAVRACRRSRCRSRQTLQSSAGVRERSAVGGADVAGSQAAVGVGVGPSLAVSLSASVRSRRCPPRSRRRCRRRLSSDVRIQRRIAVTPSRMPSLSSSVSPGRHRQASHRRSRCPCRRWRVVVGQRSEVVGADRAVVAAVAVGVAAEVGSRRSVSVPSRTPSLSSSVSLQSACRRKSVSVSSHAASALAGNDLGRVGRAAVAERRRCRRSRCPCRRSPGRCRPADRSRRCRLAQSSQVSASASRADIRIQTRNLVSLTRRATAVVVVVGVAAVAVASRRCRCRSVVWPGASLSAEAASRRCMYGAVRRTSVISRRHPAAEVTSRVDPRHPGRVGPVAGRRRCRRRCRCSRRCTVGVGVGAHRDCRIRSCPGRSSPGRDPGTGIAETSQVPSESVSVPSSRQPCRCRPAAQTGSRLVGADGNSRPQVSPSAVTCQTCRRFTPQPSAPSSMPSLSSSGQCRPGVTQRRRSRCPCRHWPVQVVGQRTEVVGADRAVVAGVAVGFIGAEVDGSRRSVRIGIPSSTPSLSSSVSLQSARCRRSRCRSHPDCRIRTGRGRSWPGRMGQPSPTVAGCRRSRRVGHPSLAVVVVGQRAEIVRTDSRSRRRCRRRRRCRHPDSTESESSSAVEHDRRCRRRCLPVTGAVGIRVRAVVGRCRLSCQSVRNRRCPRRSRRNRRRVVDVGATDPGRRRSCRPASSTPSLSSSVSLHPSARAVGVGVDVSRLPHPHWPGVDLGRVGGTAVPGVAGAVGVRVGDRRWPGRCRPAARSRPYRPRSRRRCHRRLSVQISGFNEEPSSPVEDAVVVVVGVAQRHRRRRNPCPCRRWPAQSVVVPVGPKSSVPTAQSSHAVDPSAVLAQIPGVEGHCPSASVRVIQPSLSSSVSLHPYRPSSRRSCRCRCFRTDCGIQH